MKTKSEVKKKRGAPMGNQYARSTKEATVPVTARVPESLRDLINESAGSQNKSNWIKGAIIDKLESYGFAYTETST